MKKSTHVLGQIVSAIGWIGLVLGLNPIWQMPPEVRVAMLFGAPIAIAAGKQLRKGGKSAWWILTIYFGINSLAVAILPIWAILKADHNTFLLCLTLGPLPVGTLILLLLDPCWRWNKLETASDAEGNDLARAIKSKSSVVATPAFKDRHSSLIVFGVLDVLIGYVFVLIIPLMFWTETTQAKTAGHLPHYETMIPSVAFCAVIAITFVWLGIGSIQCRRWARALLLILSWCWLLVSVISLGWSLAFGIPYMIATVSPDLRTFMIVVSVAPTLLSIIISGAMVLFYNGRNVKATCEVRDPVKRWTDTRPLPVLAASLCTGMCALSLLWMPLGSNSVVPFFGVLLSGVHATLFLLIMAAGFGGVAWALYRLNLAAWWSIVLVLVVFGVSVAITCARIDIVEMYRQMGCPQQQIEQMQKSGFISGKNFALRTVFYMVPCLGYLLWIKKFFRRLA